MIIFLWEMKLMSLNEGYLKAKTTKESDETYTPAYAIKPILKYIPKNKIVWCPFDTQESEYVKLIQKNGNTVIFSHIDEGKDFFSYEPEKYDCIVSNPPFSLKDKVLKRLYELDMPYAILLPIPSLQGQKRFPYIKDCEALIFDKRINYYKDYKTKEVQKGVSFGSFYLCRKMLPERLIFEELIID